MVGEEVFALLREACAVEAQGELWSSRIRWSSLDGQLFVHSRYPTVDADAVFFGPDTYRFAQALHQHLARDARPLRRIADIGCGAGPGAVLAALARPRAQVLALDINDRALAFTAVNARLAGAANLIPRHSDLLHQVEGPLDLIIANPPYMLDPAGRAYRHGGGEHGAGLSLAIIEAALQRLAPAAPCCSTPAWRCSTVPTPSAMPSSRCSMATPGPGATGKWTRTCSARNWTTRPTPAPTASPPWCWRRRAPPTTDP